MTIKEEDSYEALQRKIRDALFKQFTQNNQDSNSPDYSLQNTYPDNILVEDYRDGGYYKIPYTINLDGNVEFGEPIKQENEFNDVVNSMKKGHKLILLNSESNDPTYRLLLQTPKELPAHDMGYKSVQYDQATIKEKIKQLEGQFLYDETQTSHNKRKTPENRGHRFAKITNTGFCPEYGGYGDVTVFDSDYHNLMKETYNSIQDGLPIHEGPSTETDVTKAHTDKSNNLFIDDWNYTGIVWDNNPRDNVGVCKILNSIEEVLSEENNMAEEPLMTKEEYQEFIQLKADKVKLETELENLDAKYKEGAKLYQKGEKLYKELETEKEDLFQQLVPVWTQQGEKKLELVNSILNSVPEADREARKTILDGMEVEELEILNSLPGSGGDRGVGEGNGNTNANGNGGDDDEFDAENDPTMKALEKMGYF